MIAAYRAMRNLPEAARGEGGFASKEFFKGVYKAAAQRDDVRGGVDGDSGGLRHRWEIVNFILSNANVLKAYAALAFEQSPGFRQMIEWLELHVFPIEERAFSASAR